MAGDWIKMEHCLARKPEVFRMAAILKLDRFTVVGRLHALWSWADEQSVSGQGLDLTYVSLDAVVELTGFSKALAEVGWLSGSDGNLSFPNFERHNGKTAKARALNNKHQAASRANHVRLVSGSEPDKTVTREEKRREESIPVPKLHQSLFRGSPAPQSTDEDLSFEDLTAENPKKPRGRDECFEALAEIEGGHQALTITARGAVNKALKDIRSADPNVIPDEIRRRGRMYRQHFPDAILSACALAKHWARCARYPEGKNPYKTAQGNATAISDALAEAERVINQA